MMKSFKYCEKVCENVKNYVDWSREEHLRNGFSIEFFLLFKAIFKCGRIIYWFFDKWVEFCEKLLGANSMVIGRSSLSLFLFVK